MTSTSATQAVPPTAQPSGLMAILSLIVPGLGQFLSKRRGRGILIFLVTASLIALVNWALVDQELGAIQIVGLTTTWMWLPVALFWIWNVLDARAIARGSSRSVTPAILFAAVVLYVIAWSVTDVRLARLVERFNDARTVATNLLNPDMITISVNGQDQICSWGCLYDYASARLSGKPATGLIRLSDNLLDIVGRVKPVAAPRWEVNLGLAAPGSKINGFVAGTMIQTIAMGLIATILSTILAVPVSFLAARNIVTRLPGGTIIYYVARLILNVIRAIDTIVWGLIVIVWVGLGTFAGVMALTIHSVAALGKLFSEEIEHIDPGPVEAVTATGANLIQTIRYAVIPQVVPSLLSYSLLRWDINMRSATVIGFVAGGGIGFFVVETTRLGAYQQYATALWAVVVVIVIVDYVSSRWRSSILSDEPPPETRNKRPTLRKLQTAFYILIGVAALAYFWNLSEVNLRDLLNPGKNFGQIILDFVSIDLSPAVFQVVVQQMLVTVFQALLATTIGAIVALPFGFLAARNLTGRSRISIWIYYIARATLNILRSIEALLYVVIFVFWVGIGPFAGMLALAVTSFALIGKLFSEAVENIDPGPIEAIAATGANALQRISFGILPQIVPPFVSYLLYQWDINVRMATIIGFAGGGGIGLTLTTYFGSLQYHKAGTVVLLIVIVVALMDFASAKLREQLI